MNDKNTNYWYELGEINLDGSSNTLEQFTTKKDTLAALKIIPQDPEKSYFADQWALYNGIPYPTEKWSAKKENLQLICDNCFHEPKNQNSVIQNCINCNHNVMAVIKKG